MDHDPRNFSIGKISNKKVLELGSGCGLAGISFMLRGASVTFTDLPAVTETLTSRNAKVLLKAFSMKITILL